jgi:hypothetical protein
LIVASIGSVSLGESSQRPPPGGVEQLLDQRHSERPPHDQTHRQLYQHSLFSREPFENVRFTYDSTDSLKNTGILANSSRGRYTLASPHRFQG